MNKYKIVLKGKDNNFTVNTKGNINYIVSSIMQFACEVAIDNDITKKEFTESCKKTYELVMKLINEEGRND